MGAECGCRRLMARRDGERNLLQFVFCRFCNSFCNNRNVTNETHSTYSELRHSTFCKNVESTRLGFSLTLTRPQLATGCAWADRTLFLCYPDEDIMPSMQLIVKYELSTRVTCASMPHIQSGHCVKYIASAQRNGLTEENVPRLTRFRKNCEILTKQM